MKVNIRPCFRSLIFTMLLIVGLLSQIAAAPVPVNSSSPRAAVRLTVTKSGNGSGYVSSTPLGIDCGADCYEEYATVTVVTLNADANPHSTFTGWSGDSDCSDGSVTTNAAKTCTATFVLDDYTLTITKSGTGTGTVTSSPAGIDCGADCSQSYTSGTSVVLMAAPAAGSIFSGWSGSMGCSNDWVNMDADKTCIAIFTAVYPLTVAKEGTGSGTVTSSPAGINCGSDCSENYVSNTTVTLTATPSAGSIFTGWSGSADCSDGSVTMSAARSCTATFQIPYTLTIAKIGSGSGTVTSSPAGINCGADCSEVYTSGTLITLTASPSAGSVFSGWSGSADCLDGSVTLDLNRTCTATFTAQYTLTLNKVGSGSVVSSPLGIDCGVHCSYPFGAGTTVTLTASPADGYAFAGWSGACTGTGSCIVVMSQARSVTATFNAVPPGQTLLYSPSGAIASNTPDYTWQEVPGATWYYLWVNGPSGNVIEQWYDAAAICSGETCSAVPSTALNPGDHHWWVQTWNSAGYGPWSDEVIFTVVPIMPGKATLTKPNGTIFTTTPLYTWTAASDTTWYYLYVNGPSGNVIKQWYDAAAVCSGVTCSVTPSTALSAGNYKWWVQTWSSSGYGPWSDTMNFTVSAPGKADLMWPMSSIGETPAEYTWYAVEGATWYYLWVNGPSGNVIEQWYEASAVCSDEACGVIPTTTLGSGAYSWWIQTWNPVGYGPWSDRMDFTITPE